MFVELCVLTAFLNFRTLFGAHPKLAVIFSCNANSLSLKYLCIPKFISFSLYDLYFVIYPLYLYRRCSAIIPCKNSASMGCYCICHFYHPWQLAVFCLLKYSHQGQSPLAIWQLVVIFHLDFLLDNMPEPMAHVLVQKR